MNTPREVIVGDIAYEIDKRLTGGTDEDVEAAKAIADRVLRQVCADLRGMSADEAFRVLDGVFMGDTPKVFADWLVRHFEVPTHA